MFGIGGEKRIMEIFLKLHLLLWFLSFNIWFEMFEPGWIIFKWLLNNDFIGFEFLLTEDCINSHFHNKLLCKPLLNYLSA